MYIARENRLLALFVAEPLKEGVSAIFQDGGMDLAILRITHYFDANAEGKRGVPITDITHIKEYLSAMPIGLAGYAPRDQVSIIRFPIIKGDPSLGCKPKCGRVVACDGSRLHLDFTELAGEIRSPSRIHACGTRQRRHEP